MKTALVLSPFATTPADAGHRKRARQVTALLRDQGYRITFLFYAFEGGWYQGSEVMALDQMHSDWHEVIHFPADRNVGCPPKAGASHSLDEWWSDGLEAYLVRLFAFRQFDALVVHNVWLSKAFDVCPPTCCKILETHDLFWLRNAYYKTGIIKPEFFVIDESEELRGLRRSDLIVTIQITEFELLQSKLTDQAILNIPYVSMESNSSIPLRSYRADDVVTFGVMGSNHGFNVAGLKALLTCLEGEIKTTFAPVEILVAGRLSKDVVTGIAIELLGYVENEDEFYNRIDFVFVPNFSGTGFNVKVADAIGRHHPMLCAAHAAVGLPLPDALVVGTPEEMAKAMCEISIGRPDLNNVAESISKTRQRLAVEAELAAKSLDAYVSNAKPILVVDLSRLNSDSDVIRIMFWVVFCENTALDSKIFLVLPPDVLKEMRGIVARKVIYTESDDIRIRQFEYGGRLQVDSAGGFEWTCFDSDGKPTSSSSIIDDNRVVTDAEWHPCLDGLRKIIDSRSVVWKNITHFIFVNGTPTNSLKLVFGEAAFIDVESVDFDRVMSFLYLNRRENVQVTWIAQTATSQRDRILALSALRRFQVNSLLVTSSLISRLDNTRISEMFDYAKAQILKSQNAITNRIHI
jgi:hypothetical protein